MFGSAWKKHALKLQQIVLSGAPLREINPTYKEVLDLIAQVKACQEGALPAEDAAQLQERMARLQLAHPELGKEMTWEPLSDGVGDPIRPWGWLFEATMYLLEGAPWWLVRAVHTTDTPAANQLSRALQIVAIIGAQPERHRIMNSPLGPGHGYGMWWTWKHEGQLLEIHWRNGKQFGMKIVPQNTRVETGWERHDRNAAAKHDESDSPTT